MAFKKRLKSKVIDNTQVNVTSEYGRKRNKKKSCSIVINGLLMASMVLGMGATPNNIYANNSDSNVIEDNSGMQYDAKVEIDAVSGVHKSTIETFDAKDTGIEADSIERVEDSASVVKEAPISFSARGGVTEFTNQQSARASARANVKETKLAGSDRYKTAVEISKAGWNSANKALLVNGTALPDALCASPLADEYDAPILLTEKDKLNADTLTELKRLGVKEVTIIGGEGVISKSQENQLVAEGFSIERIGGEDRYATSLNIANKLKGLYQAKGNTGRKTVFLANGVKGLADATSVSSPAGIKDAVILYTNGTNLNGVKNYIETSCDDVYIIGGTNVISQGVEDELRNTTNKGIKRLAGATRKDTNAKVINEFFPNKEVDKVYVAKDGMGEDNHLVDGLAVGSLASKNNSPVVLASDNLADSQRSVISSKTVKEAVQVGEGKNATPYAQTVGIINAIAQPEAEDGMKLPTIQFAKEGNMLMTGRGGYKGSPQNIIQGNLYVKWGNPKTVPHSYGSKNQAEYDYVVNFVKDRLKTINFRLQSDWVYLQHFLNNGNKNLDDNYIDPILAKNGIDVRYKDWRIDNNYLIIGLQKGIVSRDAAEKIAMYNATVGHVTHGVDYTDDGTGSAYSAYDVLVHKKGDCDAMAQLASICGDIIGMNTAIGGSASHQDVMILVENYWWVNGRKPTLNATDNVFQKLSVVSEAPTY